MSAADTSAVNSAILTREFYDNIPLSGLTPQTTPDT
jgi:hypothetical protein